MRFARGGEKPRTTALFIEKILERSSQKFETRAAGPGFEDGIDCFDTSVARRAHDCAGEIVEAHVG